VGEGEGKKTSAGKINSSEQRSNLRAAKFFVVVLTTFVLKYEFRDFFSGKSYFCKLERVT
jgi:hypothetical protein